MNFTHIYLEKAAKDYPMCQEILSKLARAHVVEIDNYKQFFNRPKQDFKMQRKSLKLILAIQRDHFLQEGSERTRSFGNEIVVSSSMVRNCLYHCEYCFLSGMHESANIVIFVNIEDYARALQDYANTHKGKDIFFICTYLSDLPIFETLYPLTKTWIQITKNIPNVTMEIRTKGDAYKAIRHLKEQIKEDSARVVLSWSMSPQSVVRKYEHGTSSLHTRILHACMAIKDGWKVRLCFDPILYYEGWKQDYEECLKQCFAKCVPEDIDMVSYGVFRMGKDYLQRMHRIRPGARVLSEHIEVKDGLGTYSETIIREIQDNFKAMVLKYLPEHKIHFVHG